MSFSGPNPGNPPFSNPSSFKKKITVFFDWVLRISKQFGSYLKKLSTKLFNKKKVLPASKTNLTPRAGLDLPPLVTPSSEAQIAKAQILKQQIANFCINWDKTEAREKVLLEANNHSQTTSIDELNAKMQALSDYQYTERDRLYAEQKQLIDSYEKAQQTYENLLAATSTTQSCPQLDTVNQKLTELKQLYETVKTPPFQVFGEKAYYQSQEKAKKLLSEIETLILEVTPNTQTLSHKPPKNS